MKYAVAAFLAMMSLVFAEHAPAAEPKAILVFGDSLSERLHPQTAAKLTRLYLQKNCALRA